MIIVDIAKNGPIFKEFIISSRFNSSIYIRFFSYKIMIFIPSKA